MINREHWNDKDLITCDVCGTNVPYALAEKGMCFMCYVEHIKMQHMSVKEWEE